MEYYIIPRNFTPTVRTSIKLRKLKSKYENSLSLRLNRRKLMIKAVKTWTNSLVSKAWRNWRSIKKLPTSYEFMKSQVQYQILTSRKKLFLMIKDSKNKLHSQISKQAYSVKSQKKNNQSFLSERKQTEIRNKSSQAARIRQDLSTACKISRQRIFYNKISEANEVRSLSRSRFINTNNTFSNT